MNQLKLGGTSLLLFSFLFFSQIESFAQYQIGGFVGMSDYSGDLAGSPFSFERQSAGGGAYYGYYLNRYFQLRGRLTYQNIVAYDKDRESSANRNLSFNSNIIEAAAIINYEFDKLDFTENRLKPFFYVGAAVYRHNPKAEVNGAMVELQPLGTEGQGIDGYDAPYSLIGFAVPYGGGLKYQVAHEIIIEVDLGTKKTFTDYLDDVSGQEYVPPSILIQNGQTAIDAAYKADEIGGPPYSAFEDPGVRSSYPRNLSKKPDWYYLFSVGASFYLNPKKRSEIPKNRKGVPNKYSRN